MKGELTVVADGPRYKTKRGIKFASLVSATRIKKLNEEQVFYGGGQVLS